MKQFHIRFYENRKIFFAISLGVIAVGLIVNLVFGVQLDIQFSGGAMLKYAYRGEIDQGTVESLVQKTADRNVSVVINRDVRSTGGGGTKNNVTISFAGTESLSLQDQNKVAAALNKQYPDAKFELVSSNSVNPTMGRSFFVKCMVAVLIAFLLLDLYIAARFRRIGGMVAGATALIALVHDVLMVYFTFVIFRIPLNDNFIAVVLTILGYSLNDTIVIYDRIRENRRLLGPKAGYDSLVNLSVNQTLTRSVYTALCTFFSIATVFVVGSIYNLASVTTFALPMMIGIVSGCYSTVCIAGPLYVMWENHRAKKRTAAFAAGPALSRPAVSGPAEAQALKPEADASKPAAPDGGTKQKPRPKKRKR